MGRDPELHITVVALTAGRGLEMTDEVALVKAALLYADRVTLASPKAVLFASLASYLVAPPTERSEALMEIVAGLPDGAGPVAIWRALRQKKHRTAAEIIALKRMEKQLEASGLEMVAKIEEMLEEAKAGELARAMEEGVLKLDPLGADRVSEPFSTKAITEAVVTLIGQVLGPDSQSYPMFSQLTGGLARAMVREDKIAGADLAPATQAHVAGRFISALEAFPDASMDVVLDARGRLRGPLRRFRAGVTRLSRELRDISALDPRFERASADLYREHVAPALQEMDELAREMGLLTALRRASPTAARDVAVATMALAVSTGAGVVDLATLAAGATGDLIGRAALRQRQLRGQRDKNEFVFLYEAERALAKH